MAYYNYHAKVKQKIKNGELESYYFEDDYKNIGFCMVLCFKGKKYPIRESHFDEYFDLIGGLYQTKQDGKFFVTTLLDKQTIDKKNI